MELSISIQAWAIFLAHVGGWLLGLVYDMLRPLRRRAKHAWTAVLDVGFCIIAGGTAFVFAMGAGNGRLGTWELTAALAGFLLYLHTLSRFLEPILDKICSGVWRFACRGKNLTKKVWKYAKRYFQKSKECFIIKDENEH